MIIKSFAADSVASALKKVREEMGRDAIVLRTRQTQTGSARERIEITACIDEPMAGRVQTVTDDSPVCKPPFDENVALNCGGIIKRADRNLRRHVKREFKLNSDQDHFGDFQNVYGSLQQADFPDTFVQRLMAGVIEDYDQSSDVKTFTWQRLAEHLSLLLEPGLSFKPGDRLLFLGPPGAGKSSVMGKLATRLVTQDKQKVNLAGIDYSRMAAHDELACYAEILQVRLSNLSANPTADDTRSDCITLIDGPALPADPEKLAELQRKIEQVNPNYRFAVFSALTRSGDVREQATRMLPLGPTHLVMTMLDQTRRYGSTMVAAQALGIRIAFVTDSSGGVDRITTPDPEMLARAVVGELKTGVRLE